MTLSTGVFLQGFAFVDNNHNGQLDASDQRLSGAVIRLYSANGNTLLGQVTTGADGSYRFDDANVFNHNLTTGTYMLVETPPTGYANSAAQALSNLNPATVVSPSTIQVTILDPAQLTLTYNGLAVAEGVQVTESGIAHSVLAGQMSVTVNSPNLATPPAPFLTSCADVRHTIAPGDTFAVLPTPTGTAFPQHGDRIAYLYNHYGTSPRPSADAAGLQLAIWELEYDTTVDLFSGNFQYNGFFSPTTDDTALLAAANFYLNDSAGKSEAGIFLDATLGGADVPQSGRQGVLATGSLNFGNTPAPGAIIRGTKFEDLNGNGVRDASEPGLPGVTIFLDADNNGVLDPGEVSTTTDANGNYQFTDLMPGTYFVREVLQPGFVQTTANPASITVTASGQVFAGVDFGNFRLISISGTKFQDVNGNGVRDPGEPGLQGVTVFLDANNNGVLDAGEISTTTDANGNFRFTGLGPGTYTVREVQRSGWMQTTANPAAITALSGQNVTGVNFGNFQLGSISGSKFQDSNGNGLRDAGEPGLQGVTVFLDSNNNGVLDVGEVSTITDANGNFRFTGLGPGAYVVREVLQPGWMQTTAAPHVITALSGQNVTGVDFGNFQLISISGTKFQDTNGNGVRDPGEPGLQGVTVFLDANNNGVLDPGEVSTTTDANGNFSFSGLGPGTYTVREVVPPGWMQTTANPAAITAVSGQNVTGVEFGNAPSGQILAITGSNNALLPTFSLTGAFPPAVVLGGKVGLFGTNVTANMQGMIQAESNFVSGLYQNVLRRSPDAAGLTFWVQMLQDGLSRADVATRVWQSPEHRALEVNQFYTTFLHRPPDSGGLAFWTNVLVSGSSEEDVMRGILTSSEYRASHTSDTAFVNGLYSDVLSRGFDLAGRAFWLQALARGVGREAVAQGFLASEAADRRVLDDYYANFLGRAGDSAGELFWFDQLQSGRASFASVAEAFLSSDEYFARVNRV